LTAVAVTAEAEVHSLGSIGHRKRKHNYRHLLMVFWTYW